MQRYESQNGEGESLNWNSGLPEVRPNPREALNAWEHPYSIIVLLDNQATFLGFDFECANTVSATEAG